LCGWLLEKEQCDVQTHLTTLSKPSGTCSPSSVRDQSGPAGPSIGDRVFKMGHATPVSRYLGPFVREQLDLSRAHVHHGLHRDHQLKPQEKP